MMWWDHGWGWGDWLGMSLMMLVFWGLVIWLVLRGGPAGPPTRADTTGAGR